MNNIALNMIKNDIEIRFDKSTFSICSLDTTRDISLINEESIEIYNFDDISEALTKEFGNGRCQKPDSLDSLYLGFEENGITFIEFKNTIWNSINKEKLKMKIYESLALLKSYYGLNNSDIMRTKIYLVHKPDESMPATHRRLNGLCPKKFQLIEEMFEIDIMRYDASEFERYLNKYGRLPSKY